MKIRTEHRHHLITAILFGSMIFMTIGTVVYSQRCDRCKPVESLPDSGPGVISDKQLAEQLSTIQASNVVTEWNQTAVTLTLSASAGLSPVAQTRVMAIFQVAVHDAVNGITMRFATYLPRTVAPQNASAEASAIAAAHRSLVGLFPSQTTSLDTLYTNSLAAHGISPADPGIAYGQDIADTILAARSNDGSAQAQFDYTVPGAGNPGVWTRINNAPALLPGWGNVTPFVMNSSSQFLPDAPPALDSDTYTRDYNEIKEIGSSTSATRTALQTQIALFWRASPTAIWNSVLRQALATRSFDLSETARAYALFYLAAADASIACWNAKYVYNSWRPQLAIRGGDTDGNDATIADPTWTPLIATPPHPEYPSAHTTNSNSMAAVLEELFGEKLDTPITVTMSNITRQWESFDEAVDEVIDARVYSGIHFRNSDIVGARLGGQVAQFVLTHSLRPCKGRGKLCS